MVIAVNKMVTTNRFPIVASFTLLICLAAIPANTFAQTSPAAPTLPGADQILDHYLQATGGRDAWKKLTSRVSKGTIEVPGMNAPGSTEIREKAPDEMLAVFVMGGATFRQAFNAKGGWSNDPLNGLRDQTGDELTDSRRISDFSPPAGLRDRYKKFAIAGAEKIDGRDVYVLNASTENSDPDKLCFDAQTGLLIRQIVQHSTPDVVLVIQQDFSDYREVDGVKLPFVIHQSNGEVQFTINLAEIHHNVALDDTIFVMPATTRAPAPRGSDQ
jgi:zinc protease